MEWEALQTLVTDCRHDQLTALLLELTSADRRAFVAPLKAMVRTPAGEWFPFNQEAGVALVGAAVLPSASALAPWLRRWSFSYRTGTTRSGTRHGRNGGTTRDVTDDLVEVLVARGVDWLPDLAGRIATRLPASRLDGQRYELVERLLTLTGAPPPATDGYLLGAVTAAASGRSFVTRVRVDPRLAALVPRLPELDAVGRWLTYRGSKETAAFAALAADGVVDRLRLLDATVARLQRGGRANDIKGFLALYEALHPSADELAARVRDLLAMLPVASAAVAQVAQRQLIELDDAGRLAADERDEALAHLLQRPEKGVVRDTLAWCRTAAEHDPASAGALAVAVAAAFSQPGVGLQRAAVAFATRLAASLDPGERAMILVAAADLAPDLRHDVEAALGGAFSPVDEQAVGLPSVRAPRPLLTYTDPGQLVEGLVGLVNGTDAVTVEQVLEALVRLATPRLDLDLRALLQPALDHPMYARWARTMAHDNRRYPEVWYAVARVVAAALDDPPWAYGTPDLIRESPMQRAVLDRLERIADDLRHRPGPLLVSTPSDDRGVISQADLLARLAAAARDGWEPWPDDLDDALLRLDRDAAVGSQAFAEIGSDAGGRVAERLVATRPAAPVTVVAAERSVPQRPWMGAESPTVVERWRLPRVAGTADLHRHGRTWAAAATPVDPSNPRQVRLPWVVPESAPGCWALALPWHPEVVAASLCPLYATGRTHANPLADALLDLAASPGPFGDATALALALAASGRDLQSRAAATDALLMLAASGRIDPLRLGIVLADVIDGGDVTVTRLLGPLRDAVQAGAGPFIWTAFATALPRLLCAPRLPPNLADVLEVAAAAATSARASGRLAGLDELAARRGSSRQVIEARRLRDLLTR